MRKEIVDRQTAEQEFERFAEAMDLDLDFTGLDENDRRDSERDRQIFVKAVMVGRLAVDADGRPVFTPKGGATAITFGEPKGHALVAMDNVKKSRDVGKMFASMADMTGTSAATFSGMGMADLKICMAIWTLFLA
jgi:hypothetical protein